MSNDSLPEQSFVPNIVRYAEERQQPIRNTFPNLPLREGASYRRYFRIVQVHFRLIAFVALGLILLTALFTFLATPKYTAEAKLEISSYAPLMAGLPQETSIIQQTRQQDYVNTQVTLLSSLTLADLVLSTKEVREALEKYFQIYGSPETDISDETDLPSQVPLYNFENIPGSEAAYQNPLPKLLQYRLLMKIIPVIKTSLVKILVTTADRELSTRLANIHAEKFIEFVNTKRRKVASKNMEFLREQAEELSKKVENSHQVLASYAQENEIVSLEGSQNIEAERLAQLDQLLTNATFKRIQSESAWRQSKEGVGLISPATSAHFGNEIEIQIKQVEAEYAMLAETYTPEYPKMAQLKARLDSLRKSLAAQQKGTIKLLEAQYQADLEAEQRLQQEFTLQKTKAFELSGRHFQLAVLQREYESLKDLYQTVLSQLEQAQISSEMNSSHIAVVEPAAVPIFASSPQTILSLILATILGPIFGFGIACIIDYLDNTIKTNEDAIRLLGLPVLGMVPEFSNQELNKIEKKKEFIASLNNEENSISDLPAARPPATTSQGKFPQLITVTAPSSITSELFRAIRTSISLTSADKPPKVLLFTSPRKGDGKSLVTSNLAVTLAGSSNRVALIDADLRRPSLHKYFSADPLLPGLVDYLSGLKPLKDIIRPTSVPRLFLIPAGQQPPSPADLLSSRKMAELLETLAKEYDYVIVDTPPMLPVTDAAILSRVVDGVVLVVRARQTPHPRANEAISMLDQVGARILGIVLNGINPKRAEYNYCRDMFDYYEQDSTHKHGFIKKFFARGTFDRASNY